MTIRFPFQQSFLGLFSGLQSFCPIAIVSAALAQCVNAETTTGFGGIGGNSWVASGSVVDTDTEGAAIIRTSSFLGSDPSGSYTITIPEDGQISFDWDVYYNQGGTFSYVSNGTTTPLVLSGEAYENTGSVQREGSVVTVNVGEGTTFGFTATQHNVTTVHTFSFTPATDISAVPEPSGVIALGCLFGVSVLMRRR